MKRSDLESRVQITWERCLGWPAATAVEKCVASLTLRREAILDGLVEKMFPCGPVSIRREIGERLTRDLVHALLGDLESENARLRMAVEKWSRRAMAGSMPRQIEPDQWSGELKEDLK